MTEMKKSSSAQSTLADTFESLAKELDASYRGSAISKGRAPSRTADNREGLVKKFMNAVLPVSVQSRLGALLVDSLGQVSRDVDLVLLNPWAAPVWPYEHGVVPVEGALVAVFVESDWPPPKSRGGKFPIYEQSSSAKALLKWLLKTESYAVPARRTYRVETGIWNWSGPRPSDETAGIAVTVMKNLLKNWSPFERALKNSCTLARRLGWTSPAPEFEQMDSNYEAYQRDMGAMAPNWIYLHKSRLLLIKFQARSGREPKSFDDLVMVSSTPQGVLLPIPYKQSGWNSKPLCIKKSADLGNQNFRKWGYAYFAGEIALQTLALQLAFSMDLYGKERTNFGAYLDLAKRQVSR